MITQETDAAIERDALQEELTAAEAGRLKAEEQLAAVIRSRPSTRQLLDIEILGDAYDDVMVQALRRMHNAEEEREAWLNAFVVAILHGDEEHRRWLSDAGAAWCAGRPIPPVAGKSTTDRYRAALERIRDVYDYTRLGGADRAFEEMGDIARAALDATEQET